MLPRLLWKEWRLGWPLLLLGVLLPIPATLLTRAGIRFYYLDNLTPLDIVIFLLLVGVVVRASLLVVVGPSRQLYAERHFALSPAWPLVVAFLCQGFFIVLVGAAVGWCRSQLPGSLPPLLTILLSCVILLGTYALTATVSRAISPLAGMAVGLPWIMVWARVIWAPSNGGYYIDVIHFSFGETGYFLPVCLIADIIAFGIVLLPKPRFLTRQVIAMVLVVGVVLGYVVIERIAPRDDQQTTFALAFTNASADGSLAVEPVTAENIRLDKPVTMRLLDYRNNLQAIRSFPTPAIPFNFIGNQSVLLLAKSDPTHVALCRWQIAGDSVQTICTIPVRRQRLLNFLGSVELDYSGISPDGRYALIYLPALQSVLDYASDLWLVDLANGTHKLLIAGKVVLNPHYTWLPGKVVISTLGNRLGVEDRRPMAISLPDGRVTIWTLPAEGRQ
jgi:hypothetical protein